MQNPRDRLLADNLLHLSRQPEHPKIIVWAASYHLANHISRLDLDDSITARHVRHKAVADSEEVQKMTAHYLLGGAVPMGELVKRTLGPASYALGFVAVSGTYGNLEEPKSLHPVPAPPAGSIEQAFGQLGCAAGFVDLRGAPAGATFYASPLGYAGRGPRYSMGFITPRPCGRPPAWPRGGGSARRAGPQAAGPSARRQNRRGHRLC